MYTVGCTHPAFGRLREEDCELEASSDSTVRPRFKQINKKTKVKRWEKHYHRVAINYNPHKNDILAAGQVNIFRGKTIQKTLTLLEFTFYYKLPGN